MPSVWCTKLFAAKKLKRRKGPSPTLRRFLEAFGGGDTPNEEVDGVRHPNGGLGGPCSGKLKIASLYQRGPKGTNCGVDQKIKNIHERTADQLDVWSIGSCSTSLI